MEFLIFILILMIFVVIMIPKENNQGIISPAVICPHCQTKGSVRTIVVKRKKGISGAKATGAVLTMGISILATGLSRKENMTHATCGNCGSVWDF